MYWKIIGYVLVGLLGLALTIGVGVKLTQKAEGYKAGADQNFYSFEPHIMFGCASYEAFKKAAEAKPIKPIVKENNEKVSKVNNTPKPSGN